MLTLAIWKDATARYCATQRRYPTYPAAHAWRSARSEAETAAAWAAADGYVFDGFGWNRDRAVRLPPDPDAGEGRVRLRVEPDEFCSFDNLCGDSFNPKVNPDIPAAQLERKRATFLTLCEREGVWGVIGEYWDGHAWIVSGSVWGIVGNSLNGMRHDPVSSGHGYVCDIMRATLDAAMRYAMAVGHD